MYLSNYLCKNRNCRSNLAADMTAFMLNMECGQSSGGEVSVGQLAGGQLTVGQLFGRQLPV